MKLSIVIPIFNEESTLYEITQKVLIADKCDLDFEIILIDDSSIDNTPKITKKISQENKIVKLIRIEYGRYKLGRLKEGQFQKLNSISK